MPSISAQPAPAADCRAAAAYACAELASLGFDATVRETSGHPVVVAHHPGPVGAAGKVPHLLYYGHDDVQPADPIELWTSPPFEPTIVDGPQGKRVYARGAVDEDQLAEAGNGETVLSVLVGQLNEGFQDFNGLFLGEVVLGGEFRRDL